MASDHQFICRPMTVSPARLVAFTVLQRVTAEGAYASLALDAEIGRVHLDARDAALATEIVYGSLRVLPELDRMIGAHVDRRAKKKDELVTAVLRASCYQLQHLGRIPPHAIVDDAVSLVSGKRGRALGGFVNALLRKIAAQRPQAPEPPRALCLPRWLTPLLLEALGPERFEAFARARPLPPPLGLRIDPTRVNREQLATTIAKAIPKADVALGSLSPLAIVVRAAGDPRSLPGYREGCFFVQEEGAQLVALSTGAQPGERVVDACAGHGGKSRVLAHLVGRAGAVLAVDIDPRKLEKISTDFRIGENNTSAKIETLAVDLSVGTAGLKPIYDRVLVDVPCSGLGTIHRRPELLIRRTPEDLFRYTEIQQAILQGAARLVHPKGRLIYSVCSPLHQEGISVASRFEAREPNFLRVAPPITPGLPSPDLDGVTRIGPWLTPGSATSVDAYQIIQWIAA